MTTQQVKQVAQPLKNSRGWRGYLLVLFRVVLGGTFVVAAYKKLTAPVEQFEAAIRTYEVLPWEWAVELVAAALPWIELGVGALLIVGAFTQVIVWAHLVLLGVFVVLIAQGMLRGLDIDCGCFGSGDTTPWQTLIRDLVLMGVGAVLLRWNSSLCSIDRWFAKGDRAT
ncbi:MAG: DoxX family membrane protein [Candidatus Doudnabacteria bacterium]|nr:DoxX family membrane protein [Candidatus Doudnabacteria bacterium]